MADTSTSRCDSQSCARGRVQPIVSAGAAAPAGVRALLDAHLGLVRCFGSVLDNDQL
jgi:hypothetical protein